MFEDLKKEYDLVVIGGGINGAGTARDAAERGLKVLLLEKGDFASGCSSHSTRLIHGGLRYLEYFEFALVRESLKERKILLNNYPNLVNPIGLMIPHYKFNRVPKFILKMGMILYDLLSFAKRLATHRSYSRDQFMRLNPNFNSEDLDGAFFYFDAQVTFVERLVLENILTARSKGADCINYAEVTKVHSSNNSVQGVSFKHLISGEKCRVNAKNVVNLAGPWVDFVNENIDPGIKKLIGGTKGSHILVDEFRGAPKDCGFYVEAKSDNRPFFILPYKLGQNKTYYLIGTTDIPVNDEEMKNPVISDQEKEYLLSETNRLFPKAKLSKDSILKTFSGVRPLPNVGDSGDPAMITRSHFIYDHKKDGIKNYYSVIGGKITTFRNLSREIVDKFTDIKSSTEDSLTIGCEFHRDKFKDSLSETLDELSNEYAVSRKTARHLISLYGSRAREVLKLTKSEPYLLEKISDDFEDIKAQVVYSVKHENAYTIYDVLSRRLSLGLLRDDFDESTQKLVSELMSVKA